MSRPFRVLGLIVLAFSFSGCADSSAPPTPTEHQAAQETAAKMPPPPGVGTKKAK